MLILVTGKRGAGKSSFAEIAKTMGYRIKDMSDKVRELMREQGIEINSKNIRNFANDLRKEHGKGAVAKFMLDELKGDEVISGVRGISEVIEFKKRFPVVLIFIDADIKKRYNRMLNAGKKDNPVDWEDFIWAEKMEEKWGLKDIKEKSDIIIENNGTKEEFEKKVRKILQSISKKI